MTLGSASDHYATGVELLNGDGGPPGYPLQSNSEYRSDYSGSEPTGDNVRGREGNIPDRQLRSLIPAKCLRKSDFRDSQDVGLEAATI